MIIFPAIDILDGKCVRLYKGDYDKSTCYYENPLDAAKYWESQGSDYLHIVDLNGSKDGELSNISIIEKIASNTKLSINSGGGVRSIDDITRFVDAGVDNCLIGSALIKNPSLIDTIPQLFPGKVIPCIDSKDRKIVYEGWTQKSDMDFIEFAKLLESKGFTKLLYTDIDKDGTLQGPSTSHYIELMEATNIDIIASGGITTLEDVKTLNNLDIYGGIIGKAFYDKLLDFQESLSILGGSND